MHIKYRLQTKIIILVLLVVVFMLLLVGWATSRIIYDSLENALGVHALEIAKFVARMPEVRSGMEAEDPIRVLRPIANDLRQSTSAGFIVLMNQSAIRYTHPNPELIGKLFTGGDEGLALQGEQYISRAVGVSGPSIRGFVPIYNNDGEQIGVTAVGMFRKNVVAVVRKTQIALLRVLLLGLLVGVPGSILLAKAIKKTMYGMEPEDIATLLEQREAMLNCLREGVILTDRNDRIALVNEAARKLLRLPQDIVGKVATEIMPSTRIEKIRESREGDYDCQERINDIVILINSQPVIVNDEVVGVVATFRDKTEMQKLAEELTGVRRYVEGLRAKTHEFMNKLHTIAGLLELHEYEQAREYILQTTEKQQQLLSFLTRKVRDPATLGLLLGKARRAEEMGVSFILDPETSLARLPAHFPSDAMVLVLGNLLENALEAIATAKKPGEGQVTVSIYDQQDEIKIQVEDNGPGIPTAIATRIKEKGVSSRDNGRGLGLHLVSRQVEELSWGRLCIANRPEGGVRARVVIPKVPPKRGNG